MNSNVNTKWKFFVALVIGFPTEKLLGKRIFFTGEPAAATHWEMQYENFN